MDCGVVIQIVASALTTLTGIGAIVVAVWTVHESKRPQPVVYLEHNRDKLCVLLVVKNFGTGIARNISIKNFDYDIVGSSFKDGIRNSFINNGIPMLVPDAQRDTVIFAGPEEMEERRDVFYFVTLEYTEKGLFGKDKHQEEQFVLDTTSFSGSIYSQSDLHDIACSGEHIDKSLKELSKVVSPLKSIAASLNEKNKQA